jgi:peroxiredoxin Q/BCP
MKRRSGQRSSPRTKIAKTEETTVENNEQSSDKLNRIQVGEQIPSIVLVDDDENQVDILQEASSSGLVIFFYPRANTGGCTAQACKYRDEFSHYEAKGYKVFGCSADSPKSQKNWRTKHNFPYSLLCDKEFKLISLIGAKRGKSVIRSHIVISKGGILSDAKIQISPKDSSTEALKFINSAE